MVYDGGDSDRGGGERGSGFVLWRKTRVWCACRHRGLGIDVPIPQGPRRETSRLGRRNTAFSFVECQWTPASYFFSKGSRRGRPPRLLPCCCVAHENGSRTGFLFHAPTNALVSCRDVLARVVGLPPDTITMRPWLLGTRAQPLLLHAVAASSATYTQLMRCKQKAKAVSSNKQFSSHVDYFVAPDARALSKCAGGHGWT